MSSSCLFRDPAASRPHGAPGFRSGRYRGGANGLAVTPSGGRVIVGRGSWVVVVVVCSWLVVVCSWSCARRVVWSVVCSCGRRVVRPSGWRGPSGERARTPRTRPAEILYRTGPRDLHRAAVTGLCVKVSRIAAGETSETRFVPLWHKRWRASAVMVASGGVAGRAGAGDEAVRPFPLV